MNIEVDSYLIYTPLGYSSTPSLISRFEWFWYRSLGEASFSTGILQASPYFQASDYKRHLHLFLHLPFEKLNISPVGFDFPALTLWQDRYLVQKMGDRQISVAVTPTGWFIDLHRIVVESHDFFKVVQMQLLADPMVDFISLSPVSKKWPCRNFLQNSVQTRSLATSLTALSFTLLFALWQVLLMIMPPKFTISSLRTGTYIRLMANLNR